MGRKPPLLSSRAKPRDLRFSGPFLVMFFDRSVVEGLPASAPGALLLLSRTHPHRLLPSALFLSRCTSTEKRNEFAADGRTEPGACIPTWTSRERAIVPRHNVMKRGRPFGGINLRLNKPGALSILLIVQRD